MEAVDPTGVGELLLSRQLGSLEMREDKTLPLHHFADLVPWDKMPRYAPDDSLCKQTHRRYHDELQERARAGDRYAKSLLLGANPNDGAEA